MDARGLLYIGKATVATLLTKLKLRMANSDKMVTIQVNNQEVAKGWLEGLKKSADAADISLKINIANLLPYEELTTLCTKRNIAINSNPTTDQLKAMCTTHGIYAFSPNHNTAVVAQLTQQEITMICNERKIYTHSPEIAEQQSLEGTLHTTFDEVLTPKKAQKVEHITTYIYISKRQYCWQPHQLKHC